MFNDSRELDVSVIVPSYNHSKYIGQALESVVNQTLQPKEIIIIDDASDDDTSTIVNKFISQHADLITYYKNSVNMGPSFSRNLGIKSAKSTFIAFLDSDDVWCCNKLKLQIEVLINNYDIGIVGGGVAYINNQGVPISKSFLGPPEVSFDRMCISVSLPGCTSNVATRREIFDEVGFFDESLRRAEDWHMWLRIAKKYRVINIQQQTVYIRAYNRKLSDDFFKIKIDSRKTVHKLAEKREIKRMAESWTYYILFKDCFEMKFYFKSFSNLIKSFIIWPICIAYGHKRLIPTIKTLIRALFRLE